MNTFVPMTKAIGMGSLPQLVEDMGSFGQLCNVFEQERLPLALIENRDMRLPITTVANVFERSARAVGDRTLGLRVGRAFSPETYGNWIEYSTASENLGGAILRCIRTLHLHQTGPYMSLDINGDTAVWHYTMADGVKDSPNYSDHIIPSLMKFVANYLGANWKPKWVELDYARNSAAHELERQLETRTIFESHALGIAFPRSALLNPRRDPGNVENRGRLTMFDLQATQAKQPRPDLIGAVYSLISLRLLDGKIDLDGVAEIAGLSIQRIQRALRVEGLTYRKMLDEVRFQRAKALLQETDLSVTEMALALGYSEPRNFTRAFQRNAEIAPKNF